jgi:hypothetical protein
VPFYRRWLLKSQKRALFCRVLRPRRNQRYLRRTILPVRPHAQSNADSRFYLGNVKQRTKFSMEFAVTGLLQLALRKKPVLAVVNELALPLMIPEFMLQYWRQEMVSGQLLLVDLHKRRLADTRLYQPLRMPVSSIRSTCLLRPWT